MADNFPRVSGKEEIILNLLIDGTQRYGLEMIKAKPRDLKRGTIYVTLDRMEDKGLITSEVVETPEGKQGPARRMYQITGTGERTMQAMQACN